MGDYVSKHDIERMKELCELTDTRWDDHGYWTYTTCHKCDHGCQGYVGGGPVSTCSNPPKVVEVPNPAPNNTNDLMDIARKLGLTLMIDRHKIYVIERDIFDQHKIVVMSEGTRYTPFNAGLLHVIYDYAMENKKK